MSHWSHLKMILYQDLLPKTLVVILELPRHGSMTFTLCVLLTSYPPMDVEAINKKDICLVDVGAEQACLLCRLKTDLQGFCHSFLVQGNNYMYFYSLSSSCLDDCS